MKQKASKVKPLVHRHSWEVTVLGVEARGSASRVSVLHRMTSLERPHRFQLSTKLWFPFGSPCRCGSFVCKDFSISSLGLLIIYACKISLICAYVPLHPSQMPCKRKVMGVSCFTTYSLPLISDNIFSPETVFISSVLRQRVGEGRVPADPCHNW